MNTISRVTIFGAVFIVAVLGWVTYEIVRSPYVTGANVIRPQPVPFSHQHHVSDCGIDCRYCHTSVEDSSFAGIPPTQTCMNCHSHIWPDSPVLEPVRASMRDGRPLVWTRVYDLPDFVYFDHSIHIDRGVACATCHGNLAEMPLTWKATSLYMEWCLDCHRHPEKFVGPRNTVFASPATANTVTEVLSEGRWENRRGSLITNCSICHF